MFARQSFRTVRPIKSQYRRYATEPSSSNSSNAILYSGIATLAASMGYYYYKNGTDTSKITGAAKDAESKAKELAGKASAPKSAFTGGDEFLSLKLDSVENLSHNTKKLRFALPEPDQVSGLKVASALITKYKGPQEEKPIIRPYTPVSDENEKGYIDLLVKVYPEGKMSKHLGEMVPGQRLDFKGPIPKYPIDKPNKHDHVAMIAGGSGITPMYQIMRAIFKNPEDKTKVTLVFGNLSEKDILLKKEFDHLENTYPQRFRAFYVLDNPPESWRGNSGYITKELLKTVLPEPSSENIKIFVCGPPGLNKAISGPKASVKDQGELSGILKELGYKSDQVYKF